MNIVARPREARLLVNHQYLRAWLLTAEAGDVLEYHRGFLAIDRLPPGSRLHAQDASELDRVAKAAMAAADAGRAHLVQRRHGEGDYSYLIAARARPPGAPDREVDGQ